MFFAIFQQLQQFLPSPTIAIFFYIKIPLGANSANYVNFDNGE